MVGRPVGKPVVGKLVMGKLVVAKPVGMPVVRMPVGTPVVGIAVVGMSMVGTRMPVEGMGMCTCRGTAETGMAQMSMADTATDSSVIPVGMPVGMPVGGMPVGSTCSCMADTGMAIAMADTATVRLAVQRPGGCCCPVGSILPGSVVVVFRADRVVKS